MKSFFRQFRGLSHSDKLRFIAIVLLVPPVKIRLKIYGFNRTAERLKKTRPPNQASEEKAAKEFARHRVLLKLFYRLYPYDGLCLPVSLVFWRLLKREGVATDLHFGVRKKGALLAAHSWIEYKGVALTAGDDVRERYESFEIPLINVYD